MNTFETTWTQSFGESRFRGRPGNGLKNIDVDGGQFDLETGLNVDQFFYIELILNPHLMFFET